MAHKTNITARTPYNAIPMRTAAMIMNAENDYFVT